MVLEVGGKRNIILPSIKRSISKESFLPDKPLTGSDSILEFGYEDIAETLYDMATRVPAPFTIGLFGKWGSGKSTILSRFSTLVDNDEVVMVFFDIWKYESDALRRSFLIDTTQQLVKQKLLRKSAIEKLQNKLYLRFQEKKEVLKPSWRQLILAAGTGILTFILTSIIPVDLKLGTQLGTAAIVALITLFRDLLSQGVLIQDISVSQDRLTSPEEFNQEFEDILNHKNLKGKRLMIVIDNLDRVQKDKTIELLGTVKTYLSSDSADDNVVFIIACDDKAIKEQIGRVFKESNESKFSADEYLRKFFNASIRIPQVLNIEVDTFTGKLLAQTKYKPFDNDNVRQIINIAFKENPREIKQFINDLLAHCLLIERRSKGAAAVLDKNYSADNIEFIAKLQAIRQKSPDFFVEVERRAVAEAESWEDISNDVALLQKHPEAISFLKTTEWVTPSETGLFTFFTLRRSPEDRLLPGWDPYLSAALSRDIETAEKLAEKFDASTWALKLYDYAKHVANNNARLLPFLSTTFQVIKGHPSRSAAELVKFQLFFNFVAQRLPAAADLASIYDGASADFIFPEVLEAISPSYRSKVTNGYVGLLGGSNLPEESEYQLMSVIASNRDLFNTVKVKSQVNSALRDRRLTPRFLALFTNKELPEDYLQKPTRQDFVKSLSTTDLEENIFLEAFDLLTKMKIDDIAVEVITKVNDFFTQEAASGARSQKTNLANYFTGIVQNLGKALEDADTTMLHQITSHLATWQQAADSEDSRLIFTKALYRTKKYHSGDMGGHIDARVGSYIQVADLERLKTFIKEEDLDKSLYQDNFVQAMINKLEVIPLGIDSLDDPHKAQLIGHLLEKTKTVAGPDEQISYYREIHKLLQANPQLDSTYTEQYFNDLVSFKSAYPTRIKDITKSRGVLSRDQRAQLKQEN